jgi:hypothetical protein
MLVSTRMQARCISAKVSRCALQTFPMLLNTFDDSASVSEAYYYLEARWSGDWELVGMASALLGSE